jgi:hypothetical protein
VACSLADLDLFFFGQLGYENATEFHSDCISHRLSYLLGYNYL